MKVYFLLFGILCLLQLFNQPVLSQNPILPDRSVKDTTENIKPADTKPFPKNILQSGTIIENLIEPSVTSINFDDIVFSDDNSIVISYNRYAGVSFYSPYYNNNTYLTRSFRYSYPNSLIVGYDVYNPGGYYDIYSNDTLVIEFTQPSKDVAFLWGQRGYYNSGQIQVYNDNNQLAATVPVNFNGYSWTLVSLNQYSQRIKKLVLRRPPVSNNLYGHIHIDNFQFTPITTSSPIGYFDSINSDGVATGWTRDPDTPNEPILVHYYLDGPAGQGGTFIGESLANLSHPDPNQTGHGFSYSIPAQYRDGLNHSLYVYGIDKTGDTNILMAGSPKPFNLNPEVTSVVFKPITNQVINGELTNSEIDIPAYGFSSQRIFPDRKDPETDTINHKRVRVEAIVGKPNVNVYFRNFDVDDPSADPDIDDTSVNGNDNREGRVIGQPYPATAAGILSGSSGLCSTTSSWVKCPTDSNGVATAYFTVTKQPGDNFVVAASTNQTYIEGVGVNGTGLKDSANNPLPTMKAKRTELLTVWRYLYLEVDSMGEVADNSVAGFVRTKGEYIDSTPKSIEIHTSVGVLEERSYKETKEGNTRLSYGGRMVLAGGQSLQVIDNTDIYPSSGPTGGGRMEVLSLNGPVYLRPNHPFKLYDDDDFNDSDGLLKDGDNGENVEALNDTLRLMQVSDNIDENLYAAAYIKPQRQWAEGRGLNNSNVPFELYSPCTGEPCQEQREDIETYRGSKTLERDDFWVGYLLISYQGEITRDVDSMSFAGGVAPYRSNTTRKNEDFYNPETGVPPGGIGAVIFIEAMRDLELTKVVPVAPFEILATLPRTRTAPHEVGHQFGLGHGGGANIGGGVMSYNESLYFSPQHINMMRWRIRSPGEGE